MPLTLRLSVMLLALASANARAGQDSKDAWWLTASFEPVNRSYESLPVRAVHPNWVKLSVLSYARLPEEAQGDISWMKTEGSVFQLDNQFRRAGKNDRLLCGVYEDALGQRGCFLLILERTGTGPWQVAYVAEEPGAAGFSVLRRGAPTLFWATCMECDFLTGVHLKRRRFVLEGVPLP